MDTFAHLVMFYTTTVGYHWTKTAYK